jgi:hypothetical protein
VVVRVWGWGVALYVARCVDRRISSDCSAVQLTLTDFLLCVFVGRCDVGSLGGRRQIPSMDEEKGRCNGWTGCSWYSWRMLRFDRLIGEALRRDSLRKKSY